jgi:thiol-disulfide isomerase/thioredoxin
MFKHKILTLGLLLSLFTMTAVSCGESKSKNEGKENEPQVKELAYVSSSDSESSTPEAIGGGTKVYHLKAVTKQAPGKAHDFTWEAEGKIMSFLELTRDKVVFLNFWGTWCPPCRAEIPAIIELDKELPDNDFIVIGIALERDVNNAMQNVAKFAKAKGIEYINILDSQQLLAAAYGGIRGVPTTYIIDKKSNIGETLIGARTKDAFLNSIKKFLKVDMKY